MNEEQGYTVNQDDYTIEPVLSWEDECRQYRDKEDARVDRIEAQDNIRHAAAIRYRDELRKQYDNDRRWLPFYRVMEAFIASGIWAIFLLLLGHL
jgi:hypothetical protein